SPPRMPAPPPASTVATPAIPPSTSGAIWIVPSSVDAPCIEIGYIGFTSSRRLYHCKKTLTNRPAPPIPANQTRRPRPSPPIQSYRRCGQIVLFQEADIHRPFPKRRMIQPLRVKRNRRAAPADVKRVQSPLHPFGGQFPGLRPDDQLGHHGIIVGRNGIAL